jgi:carboxylate-amine ligase
MLTSQLEAVTTVCRTLDEVHAEVLRARSTAAAAAATANARILATSSHPFATPDEIEMLRRPRYDRLGELFADVLRVNLCGCHVHVGVPDLDTAVAVCNLAREYLPLLIALAASSPFYAGRDTGHDSFRIPRLGVLPQGGPPPVLRSAEAFDQTVAELRAHGLVEDATGVLWSLRPSTRYPTLEFRVADVCPDARDTVLLAAVIRALVCVLGDRIETDAAPAPMPDPVVRAACWHAARFGTTGTLWSPARQQVAVATVAIDDFLTELRPQLAARGELDLVRDLMRRRTQDGSSADRQRRVLASDGSLAAVVRDGVELTARGA